MFEKAAVPINHRAKSNTFFLINILPFFPEIEKQMMFADHIICFFVILRLESYMEVVFGADKSIGLRRSVIDAG